MKKIKNLLVLVVTFSALMSGLSVASFAGVDKDYPIVYSSQPSQNKAVVVEISQSF
jgi:hypothetical protein